MVALLVIGLAACDNSATVDDDFTDSGGEESAANIAIEPPAGDPASNDEKDDLKSTEELLNLLASDVWYCYFVDGGGRKLYTLSFSPLSGKMKWGIGYYESEYINNFEGSYSIDEKGVFRAKLYDELRDVEMRLDFTIDVVKADGENSEIALTITQASLDKYKEPESKTIYFTLNSAPDYPLMVADYVIEQKTGSRNIFIHVEADCRLSLKENILYDGSDEEYFKFSFLENSSIDEYFASLSDEGMQYAEDGTLAGKTPKGYDYRVFYRDKELRKGQFVRCYKIFVNLDETLIVLVDAYHYEFKEGLSYAEYYEKYILTVIQSIELR